MSWGKGAQGSCCCVGEKLFHSLLVIQGSQTGEEEEEEEEEAGSGQEGGDKEGEGEKEEDKVSKDTSSDQEISCSHT